MMLISPSLRSRIVHTTHRCSGHLFLVHLRHKDEVVVYYPYGQSGTEQHLRSPEALSTEDILVPTPGWMAPAEQAHHSPAKDAHVMARDRQATHRWCTAAPEAVAPP